MSGREAFAGERRDASTLGRAETACPFTLAARGVQPYALCMPKARSGLLLMATGALHQVVGLLAGLNLIELPGGGGRKPLLEIAQAGVLAAVEPDLLRSAFVWFILFGFLVLMVGDLARRWERTGRSLPAAFGAQVIALALLGIVLLPVSGFWLCLPQGAWIVMQGQQPRASA